MDEDKIKKQAKAIMDEFMVAMKDSELAEEVSEEIGEGVREPEQSNVSKDFKKRFLENAPKTKDGYIAAEKKKW